MQEFDVIHECVTILPVGKCDVLVMKTVVLVVANTFLVLTKLHQASAVSLLVLQ